MNSQWSCGTIFAGAVLLIMVLAAIGILDISQPVENNTTATIIAAHKACEAQTGRRCD